MRIIAAAVLLVAAAAARGFAADSAGALPDVLIQAEEKRPVNREKPELNLQLKEDAPLESGLGTEDEVRLRIPSEIARSTAFVPAVSDSPHVVLPYGSWVAAPWKGAPVRVFFPRRELARSYSKIQAEAGRAKGRWELIVVDSMGKVFRRFDGEAPVPERLEFDGRGDEGAWTRVGQSYTPVLTYHDPAGRAHTAVGRPFALAGLSLREPAGGTIFLAPRLLFDRDSGAAALSKPGERLLQEAAALIQRHHPGLALEVTAKLSRKDPAWVQAAARAVAKDLAARLLLPQAGVSVRSQAGTADVEEGVEVRLLNR